MPRTSARGLLLSAVLSAFFTIPLSATAAPQEASPCHKLSVNEVRYPAGNAARVAFVTATDRLVSSVLITGCVRADGKYVQEWQTTGFVGANGFAPEGQLGEGEFRSPTGSFSVTEALGVSNPGTALQYYAVNPRSRWGGPGSPSYNTYLESGSPTDENIWYWANEGTYSQAAVINYNRPPDSPAVPGADYAIFFGAGNRESAGCVSTTLDISTRVVQTFAPGDRIVMGIVDDVFLPPEPVIVPTQATPAPSETSAVALPPPANVPDNVPDDGYQQTESSTLINVGVLLTAVGFLGILIYFILRRREGKRQA